MGQETKKLKKLSLKKEIVSSLNNKELQNIQGGWTTSHGICSMIVVFDICCDVNTSIAPYDAYAPKNPFIICDY
jgi:bacteriocin-like protein